MTSGERRGLVDMTISLDYDIARTLLLDTTRMSEDKTMLIEDTGLSTESGSIQYARTEYVSDYKPNNKKNPLAEEDLSVSLVLNEDQKHWLSSSIDRSIAECIQLTTKEQLEAKNASASLDEFSTKMTKMHVIYEFEKVADDNSKTLLQCSNAQKSMLMPLNDLLDLCVKSQAKKTALNYSIPGDLIPKASSLEANWNVDMYICFDEYPIDFCQCNNGGFLMTQPTTMLPYMMHVQYPSSRAIEHLHNFSLAQDQITTKLYAQPSDISKGTTTYKQALSAHGQWYNTQDHALELFDLSSTDVTGISYSYIVGIDQSYAQNGGDNPTIYSNGDIYGSIEMTKSMYDPLYTMQMKAGNNHKIYQCRTYCGVQNSQNKLLLKYYDDVDYTFIRKPGTTAAAKSNHQVAPDGTKLWPYQKVEYFQPCKMSVQAKHKSNLFSIKVKDSGLDDTAMRTSGVTQELADQIKRDLFNGMKALADSIAPANTQLFKAYYVER